MSCKAATRQTGDVAIVDLSGRITLGDGSGLVRDTIKDILKQGGRSLLLNLQNVTYIDSAGLGELVGAYVSVTNAGGRIKLLNAQGKVTEVLAVTKLYTVFETFSDEGAALRSYQAGKAGA